MIANTPKTLFYPCKASTWPYPGYQRFFLACDEELRRPQVDTSSALGRRHERGSRESLLKTRPKAETAHEKSLAARVTWPPTIDKPTRVHHNSYLSYSLIDNIVASNLEDTITSGNLRSNWSLFSILYYPQSKKMLLRDFSNYSEAKFLNKLSQLDSENNVNK